MWWATYSLSQFAICVLSCAKGFLEQKSIIQPSSTSFLWCGHPLDATLGFDTQWMARWLDFVCLCGHPGLSNQTCSLCRKCSVGFQLIKTLKKRGNQLLHTLKHASCNSTWVVLDGIYTLRTDRTSPLCGWVISWSHKIRRSKRGATADNNRVNKLYKIETGSAIKLQWDVVDCIWF